MMYTKKSRKFLLKSSYTFEIAMIVYSLLCILLLFTLDSNVNPLWIVFWFVLALYATTAFFFKRFTFYVDNYEIIYPSRFYMRKRIVLYGDIKKVKFTMNQIMIIKEHSLLNNYISTRTSNMSELVTFLKKLREKGVYIEIKSNDPKDLKLLD